ncbi:MAG: Na/Pi symporter, partial [Bacteroidales bacterium]|nr:Na/Pi symporter [Bacteroidales bacterium]
MISQILKLLGSLALFLYGMNLMSTGIQKATGNRLRSLLGAMTSNPFKGVLTGFGITAIIQSSSATTVLVVSFVSAGLLSLAQAIGVIMGANIGTTVTAWIISIFGFKFDIASLSIPLFFIGFLLMQTKKDKNQHFGEFIIGFSLLFLGLSLIKSFVPDLKNSPESLAFISNWSGFGFGSVLLAVLFGTVLTLVLQSSSATMAITLIMLDQQWISFDMGAAMVL